MIKVQCPSCKRSHQAPESILGKRVKCKDCGANFVAERPAAPTNPSGMPPSAASILAGFHAQRAAPREPQRPADPPQEEEGGAQFVVEGGATGQAPKVPAGQAPGVGRGSLSTRKKLLLIGIPAGLILVAGIVVAIMLGLKSNGTIGGGGGATWGSPYNVDYKLTSGSDPECDYIAITVKGPATNLAVILKDPDGKPDIKIISKEAMIANSQTIKLNLDPKPGKWELSIKTVDPEKVVWEKGFTVRVHKVLWGLQGMEESRIRIKDLGPGD